MSQIKLAIGQYSSVHLNLDESVQKLESIFEEAARSNCQLLVVGETWLSGYPAWLDHCADVARWDYEPMKEVFLKLYNSSVSISGKEINHIASLCAQYKVILCLGVNEKKESGPGNGTIYNSVLIIDDHGKLLNHHRKLMPTYTEKMLYGLGDGAGLKSVNTSIGRISTSICWEHWMPLTRQTLHNSGEDIHIALWPTVHEMHQVASRHYAFEGRCFVMAAGQMLKASSFPSELQLPENLRQDPDQWVLTGGSCVINPKGNFITAPLFNAEELITVLLIQMML